MTNVNETVTKSEEILGNEMSQGKINAVIVSGLLGIVVLVAGSMYLYHGVFA